MISFEEFKLALSTPEC